MAGDTLFIQTHNAELNMYVVQTYYAFLSSYPFFYIPTTYSAFVFFIHVFPRFPLFFHGLFYIYHLLPLFLTVIVISLHVPGGSKYLNVPPTLACSMRRTSLITQHLVSVRRPQRKMAHSSLINVLLLKECMFRRHIITYQGAGRNAHRCKVYRLSISL